MSDYTLHEGFPNILLQAGMQLRLNAIDPVVGDEVPGVVATKWSIYGEDAGDGELDDVVPLYTAEEIGDPE